MSNKAKNKTVEILFHTISYYFRDTDLDIDCCGEEQICYMINQGFSEGDLNIADPTNPEQIYYGNWHIKKED